MRYLVLLGILVVAGSSVAAQTPASALKTVRQIKFLNSDRNQVRKALHEYLLEEDSERRQEFSNFGIGIRVDYSGGQCESDADEDDVDFSSDLWKVSAGKVIQIVIEFDEEPSAASLGIALSRFKKEPRFNHPDSPNVYHDKESGLAIFEYGDDEVERVILFPSKSSSKSLCGKSEFAKDFYARESWYAKKLEDRDGGCTNQFANVEDVQISKSEVGATYGGMTVSIVTIARDPENDVLTYNYTVTAGRISGVGARVTWDLTGVPPGTYTITAAVDDGCGICGATVTKSVAVK